MHIEQCDYDTLLQQASFPTMKTIAALLLGATLLATTKAEGYTEVWFFGCSSKCCKFNDPRINRSDQYLLMIGKAWPYSDDDRRLYADWPCMGFTALFGNPTICASLKNSCPNYGGIWTTDCKPATS